MALSTTVKHPSGATFANAYVRVDRISGGKTGLEIETNAYLSAEAAAQGKASIVRFANLMTPALEEGNFIQQAYEYLKTLPEFEGAEDC
jgi:hypothetical protein